MAGPLAPQLERDPIAAWFTAAVVLLEHGLLDGFRQGWRKSYVELFDGVPPGQPGSHLSLTRRCRRACNVLLLLARCHSAIDHDPRCP